MRHILTALLCLVSAASVTAAEHPISITEVNVFVTKNRANVQLHLFAEDLNLFHDLESDNFDVFPPDELKRGIEEHKSFLADNFIIRDAAGEILKGSLVNLQQFEMPEGGIPAGDLMNYKLMYQFEYQFEEPPEFLTFETRLSDPDFLIPSEAKLILKQSGNEAVYTQALKLGEPHTAPRFDWTNPGVGEDATQAEWDAWFENNGPPHWELPAMAAFTRSSTSQTTKFATKSWYRWLRLRQSLRSNELMSRGWKSMSRMRLARAFKSTSGLVSR